MNTVYSNRLIDDLVTAAQRGWSPDELLHILGPTAHPLLYRAAPRIPARIASPYLRHEWLMLTPPRDPFFPTDRVHEWLRIVPLLPRLRDVPLLEAPQPSNDHSCVRRKIDALLRKAESTTFPAEAEALISRAQALRQEYRLQDCLTSPGDVPVVARRLLVTAPYIRHKFALLSSIGHANSVTSLLIHDSGIVTALGTSEDLDHTADLFRSLSRQCAHFMTTSPDAREAKERGQTSAYRRNFQLAFAARIGELLEEANTSAPTPTSSEDTPSLLPLLAQRIELVEYARDSLFPNLTSVTLNSHNYGGLHDGAHATEAAHLNGDSAGLRAYQAALSA